MLLKLYKMPSPSLAKMSEVIQFIQFFVLFHLVQCQVQSTDRQTMVTL